MSIYPDLASILAARQRGELTPDDLWDALEAYGAAAESESRALSAGLATRAGVTLETPPEAAVIEAAKSVAAWERHDAKILRPGEEPRAALRRLAGEVEYAALLREAANLVTPEPTPSLSSVDDLQIL